MYTYMCVCVRSPKDIEICVCVPVRRLNEKYATNVLIKNYRNYCLYFYSVLFRSHLCFFSPVCLYSIREHDSQKMEKKKKKKKNIPPYPYCNGFAFARWEFLPYFRWNLFYINCFITSKPNVVCKLWHCKKRNFVNIK